MQQRSRGIDLQVVEDHDNLFVMAELIHFVGIGLLAWKLLKKKNAGGESPGRSSHSAASPLSVASRMLPRHHGLLRCDSSLSCLWASAIPSCAGGVGLSLRTQELTAIFLAVRLYCRYVQQMRWSGQRLRCARVCIQQHQRTACHTKRKFDGMLTLLFVPAWCSFMMEYDVHTVLDMLTLVATAAVIYQLRVKLVDTYQDDQDSVKTYYVVRVPLGVSLLG
jgi:hypothetical protein